MSNIITASLGVLACVLLVGAVPLAHASSITFTFAPLEKTRYATELKAFLEKETGMTSAFSAAVFDLNTDGLPEFIAAPAECLSRRKLCPYTIAAAAGSGLVTIGKIDAWRLQPGNTYTAGVRNIRAYKNLNNDYSFALYVWDAMASRYILDKMRSAKQ